MRRGATSSGVLAILAIALFPALAGAQIDEGRRLMEEADFEGAIAALDRAEQQDGLTREEVISLFEIRSIARRANGDTIGARLDLEALATLDPDHVFPAEAPPELADELRALGAAGLTVEAEWDDDSSERVTVTATVRGDSRALVTDLVIWTRSGTSAWRRSSGPSVTIDARTGRAEAYVEAIGPGGAVIAEAGTHDAPLTHRVGSEEATRPVTPGGRNDTLLHIGIGAGAGAVALVLIIVIAVVLSQPTGQTRIDGPVVVGF